MLSSRFYWQIMEHWQIMEYNWDCPASHWWQNYCKTGCSLVSGGHWALSRATSMATGRHESGRAGLPGSGRRCCPSFLHQSQALTLTLLAQGFFPCTWPIASSWRDEEKRGRTEHAASSCWYPVLWACQHHWEEGINHGAVWHGCAEKRVPRAETRGHLQVFIFSFLAGIHCRLCVCRLRSLTSTCIPPPHAAQGVLGAGWHWLCHHLSSLPLRQAKPVHLSLHQSPLHPSTGHPLREDFDTLE